MRRLFAYLGPVRNRFLRASAYSIVNKALDMMPPFMVAWIIDSVSGQTPAWLASIGVEGLWPSVWFLCGLIVVVFGGESFFEWLYQLDFRTLSQDVQFRLRSDAYTHMQGRELAFFENSRTGNLISIIYTDISQLERFLSTLFNQILQLIFLFIFALLMLLPVSWEIAVASMLTVLPIVGGSLIYQRWIGPKYVAIREAVGEVSSRLENNISGIQVIKSFTAETYETQRVEAVSETYRQANLAAVRLNSAYVPLIRMFIALGFAVIMLMGCYWYVNGLDGFSLGNLALVAMLIQRLLWPVTGLGTIFDEYERARASARRIFGLMDAPSELASPAQPLPLMRAHGALTFEGVDFAYQPGQPVLTGIDFAVAPGETIGVAGPTGAGKTTLIKLLMRFYDPSAGKILLDGHALPAYDLADLRRQMALVSQDTYLFHGTIGENIAYGQPRATAAAIRRAAELAQLHPFVATLPEGYDTVVGERGIKLSGGQRQRLSIARAILKDAPILILDEATSAVDSETEQAIQESLDTLVQGRTAIISAHRLSTIRHADRILVFDQGRVAESGSHESLLAQNGIYAGLWRVQTGER